MSHESNLVVPLPSLTEKAVIIPALEAMPRPPLDHSPNAGDARAVEALFAAKQKEPSAVAGLLGLWTGTMLLNDLAMDLFSEPAGEVEPEEKRPEEKEE
jgi:hypothetical protein